MFGNILGNHADLNCEPNMYYGPLYPLRPRLKYHFVNSDSIFVYSLKYKRQTTQYNADVPKTCVLASAPSATRS